MAIMSSLPLLRLCWQQVRMSPKQLPMVRVTPEQLPPPLPLGRMSPKQLRVTPKQLPPLQPMVRVTPKQLPPPLPLHWKQLIGRPTSPVFIRILIMPNDDPCSADRCSARIQEVRHRVGHGPASSAGPINVVAATGAEHIWDRTTACNFIYLNVPC
jgi:hypothetical protein